MSSGRPNTIVRESDGGCLRVVLALFALAVACKYADAIVKNVFGGSVP